MNVPENVMRHAYRALGDDARADMQQVKDIGLEFYQLIGELEDQDGYDFRCLALAKTRIEEAVMWAVKAITV